MKKIIGSLGVAVIAATMFFCNNISEGTNEMDLASLVSLSSANAEGGITCSTYCYSRTYSTCTFSTYDSNFNLMYVTCHDSMKK